MILLGREKGGGGGLLSEMGRKRKGVRKPDHASKRSPAAKGKGGGEGGEGKPFPKGKGQASVALTN